MRAVLKLIIYIYMFTSPHSELLEDEEQAEQVKYSYI